MNSVPTGCAVCVQSRHQCDLFLLWVLEWGAEALRTILWLHLHLVHLLPGWFWQHFHQRIWVTLKKDGGCASVSTADEFGRAVWRLCAAAELRLCFRTSACQTQLRSAETLQKRARPKKGNRFSFCLPATVVLARLRRNGNVSRVLSCCCCCSSWKFWMCDLQKRHHLPVSAYQFLPAAPGSGCCRSPAVITSTRLLHLPRLLLFNRLYGRLVPTCSALMEPIWLTPPPLAMAPRFRLLLLLYIPTLGCVAPGNCDWLCWG